MPKADSTASNQEQTASSPNLTALALGVGQQARKSDLPLLLVASDMQQAYRLEESLRFFLDGSKQVSLFPDWETLPYDIFSPHQDIISQRLETLYRLLTGQAGVVVVSVATLMQRLPPTRYLQQQALVLETGQRLDSQAFREQLERAGYVCVSQVIEHGEFALRGSLIDIYPMGSERPYRIDLFDEEIDSIRSFDPESQRSQDKVDAISTLPAREFPLSETGRNEFRRRYRQRFEANVGTPLYRDISQGQVPAGIEYYLPLFFDDTATLFDYLPKGSPVFSLPDAQPAAETFLADTLARFEQRRHDRERPILAPEELFLSPQEIREHLAAGETLQDPGTPPLPDLSLNPRAEEPLAALKAFLGSLTEERMLISAESAGRREALLEILRKAHLQPSVVPEWADFLASDEKLCVTVSPLTEGLWQPDRQRVLISEAQLYGERVTQRRRRRRDTRDADAIINNLTELQIGAPVVHEDHGVGRYQGLQTLDTGGVTTEFLTLEFAGGDKLYVPVSNLHLVSRYTGAGADTAPLHKLGTDKWEKAKRKAREKVRDVAAELLDIHARRAARKGHAIQPHEREMEQFRAGFPFEETPDQETAIAAVLADMVSEQPMDRVVCGDVGFGKTEVAMRAAFAAVQDGRQVAVLVPTTLLAQQHYRNFSDRFADWPVRIEALSRFSGSKKVEQTLQAITEGGVDIVIGTHKLIQGDVRFKNLGLVIIDEEQRFGVRHKERLKQLRAEVDLLTLTATPIPRTLNMAMAGMRDLSIIATPPTSRHAIKTFVGEWDDTIIREAVLRELKRGGQVYFLHNEVKSIERMARQVEEVVPEARIGIAHGQMPERELEQVMTDFYHQRFNLLLATTIIESGIDIPNANTIIINRADKLGLAQLHQLRGRVGRSHHRAYAYMLTPPKAVMTPDAVKRLEAIAALEDLGVGFTLATHDLEIRGAGELLGEEQSGQIQEVGFTLYTELLERAVKALKSGRTPELEAPLEHGAEIDLRLPALIPEDYVADVHTRLILYKRIANAENQAALDELRVELIDRFGLLPEATRTLFEITALKLQATPLGIRKIEAGAQDGRLLFTEKPEIDPLALIQLIQGEPQRYRFNGTDTLRFAADMETPQARLEAVQQLLARLGQKAAD